MNSEIQTYHEKRLQAIEITRKALEEMLVEYRKFRDEAIREAVDAGLTQTSVAEAAGLTRSRVGELTESPMLAIQFSRSPTKTRVTSTSL